MKDRPNRVYWHRNKWQYKVRDDERKTLHRAWIPLGKSKEKDFTPHFWEKYAELQSRLNSIGGMEKIFNEYINYLHKQTEAELLKESTTSRKIKDIKNYLIPVFGHMSPEEIKTKHVQQYVIKRGEKAKDRANKELGHLKQVFDKARQWGLYEGSNPCIGVEKNKYKKVKKRVELWQIEQFKKGCRPLISLYVDLRYMTGLRPSDVLNIKVSDCGKDGISNSTQKTDARFFIPYDDELKKVIREIMKLNKVQGPYLFSSVHGKKLPFNTLKGMWHQDMNKCIEKGYLDERFKDYDMRATFADMSREKGYDVSENLTHSSEAAKQVYEKRNHVFNIKTLERPK